MKRNHWASVLLGCCQFLQYLSSRLCSQSRGTEALKNDDLSPASAVRSSLTFRSKSRLL